jgi:hypothetical protein
VSAWHERRILRGFVSLCGSLDLYVQRPQAFLDEAFKVVEPTLEEMALFIEEWKAHEDGKDKLFI